tara:strand:+ start:319 stop:1038 length:720 start_codon:yes stop_codon:yes gene_type:complete
MSIWGRIIGGAIGWSLLGPFGIIIGSIIGSKISSKGNFGNFGTQAAPQQIFAVALIVLSAKVCKADNIITKDELLAVKEKLKIPESEIDNVGKLFNAAAKESTGYEPYCAQLNSVFANAPQVKEEIINILLYISESDGIDIRETNLIEDIAKNLGINKNQFKSIQESRKGSNKLNPYIVLGCKPSDNLKDIRRSFLILAKENHPDVLAAKGVPAETLDQAKQKMRAINSAWDQIQKSKK